MPGNGDWGGRSVKPGGGQRRKPWFPCRSSVVQRMTLGGWKSSGLAASCCEFKAVTRGRSAQWWLLSRRPRQHEGHVHADIALVPASVCQDRPHRYAKVVRGIGRSGGARVGQQVESGDLFLFFNRRGDRVKVLWFAGDGLVIWYRRLESGTFEVPRAARAVQDDGSTSPAGIEIRLSDLTLILEGIDLSSVRRCPRWRRARCRLVRTPKKSSYQ